MMHQPEFDFLALAQAHPVTPSVRLAAAAQSDSLLEIRGVRALMARPGDLADAFSLTNGARLYTREICETLVSVACTASLAAYLRPGEPWRIEGIPANSRRALRLLAELHLLRSDVAQRDQDAARFLESQMGNEFSERLRRAYALLDLALDALDGRLKAKAIWASQLG